MLRGFIVSTDEVVVYGGIVKFGRSYFRVAECAKCV